MNVLAVQNQDIDLATSMVGAIARDPVGPAVIPRGSVTRVMLQHIFHRSTSYSANWHEGRNMTDNE